MLIRSGLAYGKPLMSNVRSPMFRTRSTALLFALSSLATTPASAQPSFTGNWYIDLRSSEQRQQKAECGEAYFKLLQVGDQVTGDHGFVTVGCGRLNEGGEETVKGVVVGATAVLVVTSGRNGGMVLGKAARRGDNLYWVTLEELKPGEPEGDSLLILGEGLLKPRK